jgi:hypothetical protein
VLEAQLFVDRERTLVERKYRPKVAISMKHIGKIAQTYCRSAMLRTEHPFIDCEGTLAKRLRPGTITLTFQCPGQKCEVIRRGGMLRTEPLFVRLQSALEECATTPCVANVAT